MKYYSKDIDGNVTEILENTNIINCHTENLTELKLHNDIEKVFCYNNKLTELELPKGVETVHCDNNKLTELILPEGVKSVHCDYIKDISKQFHKVEKRIEIYIK